MTVIGNKTLGGRGWREDVAQVIFDTSESIQA